MTRLKLDLHYRVHRIVFCFTGHIDLVRHLEKYTMTSGVITKGRPRVQTMKKRTNESSLVYNFVGRVTIPSSSLLHRSRR